MRRQPDTRTDLDAPQTPPSGDIAACSLAVTCAERHVSMLGQGHVSAFPLMEIRSNWRPAMY
jgi:hypothetical protein